MWGTICGLLEFALLALILAFVGLWLFLQWTNDFPNRRRYCKSDAKLRGKTAIVTGSSSGIGIDTARELAKRGARVIMACRNLKKAQPICDEIKATTGNENVTLMQLDLSDLDSVHKFCKEFNEKKDELHLLINNAGLGEATGKTKQKFDLVIGTNYIGTWVLTHLLLDKLKKSRPSRIVTVASHMAWFIWGKTLNLKERDAEENLLPELPKPYYFSSKLLVVMHTRELAKRLQDSGVTCYVLSPGFMWTGLMNSYQDFFSRAFANFYKWAALDTWTGAQTTLHCALEEGIEHESGMFFENCHSRKSPKMAYDDGLCKALWDVTLRVVPDKYLSL